MLAVSCTRVPPQLKVTVSGSQSPPFCGLTKCQVPVPLHVWADPLLRLAADAGVTTPEEPDICSHSWCRMPARASSTRQSRKVLIRFICYLLTTTFPLLCLRTLANGNA